MSINKHSLRNHLSGFSRGQSQARVSAFTLIELLVVIAIIAILAALRSDLSGLL